MADAIIQQGMFTSNGHIATINLYSGVDWLKMYNLTNAAADQTVAVPVEWYWQNGMPAGYAWCYKKSEAADAANLSQYGVAQGGFTLVDSSVNLPGIPVAVTSTSNANPFVVTVADTAGLSTGTIVQLQGTSVPSLNGFQFEITTVVASTSFTCAVNLATTEAASAGGFYTVIPYNPYYYPSSRTIANVTQAVNAVVTTTVTHYYKVGQQVSFRVYDPFGMTELNLLTANITAVTQYTFTTDLNTTAFSAFTWDQFPNAATFPTVIPVGIDTSLALANNVYEFNDATINQAYRGIQFPGATAANTAATAGPAGLDGDVIMWVAGVSYLVDNTADLIIQP